MAPTSDNHKPISPTSGAGKGHKCLLWRCCGYFTAILQKFFKSGRKQKDNRKVPPNPNIISLISPAQELESINNFTEELSRQAILHLELTRRYGTSNIKAPYDYGTINKDSRRTH